jgi:hypothetical protein
MKSEPFIGLVIQDDYESKDYAFQNPNRLIRLGLNLRVYVKNLGCRGILWDWVRSLCECLIFTVEKVEKILFSSLSICNALNTSQT